MKIIFTVIDQGHFHKGLIYKANRQWTPYVTAIMAAMQRNAGHEVHIFDGNACRWDNTTLARKITNELPYMVVLMTQPSDRWQNPYPSIDRQKDFAKKLRAEGFEGVFLAVGPHPTLLPDLFLQEIPEIDYIIRGEPEIGVDAFIRRVASHKSFDGVAGLSARVMGEVVHFGQELRIDDMNKLPLPAYDLLPMAHYQHHFYSHVADPNHRFAFIETNRGCPFGCSFCNLSLYGRKVRRFAVERVLEEIDLLVSKFNVNYIFFGDLTFGIHRRDTEKLLNSLIKRNYKLRWSCQTRVDIIDEELISLMARAGCHRVEAGIETADAGLMEEVKHVKIQQLRAMVAMLEKYDIKLESGHLIGLPGQSIRQVWHSARVLRKIGVRFKITSVTIPYPKTSDFERGLQEGKITSPDWNSIVRAAGKSGNNFSDTRIRFGIYMVQCLYYWHVFSHGLRIVISDIMHLRAALRGALRLFYRPRDGAGAIKRTFEDAVYGAE